MRVSVIGGETVDDETFDVAVELGTILGTRGHDVVCGGLTGVMAGVAKGMHPTEGSTIGILPGSDPTSANRYVDVPVATGMGNARNVLVVLNGDAVIAIDGGVGTLSEIGHALNFGRPVVGLQTHDVSGVTPVDTPSAAVDYVENQLQ